MSDQVPATLETFRERVTAKVRDDVAGMLPDEVLAELVQEAVRRLFESKRRVRRQWGGGYDESEYNWLDELVREFAAPLVAAHVKQWLQDNRHQISAALQKKVNAHGPALVERQMETFDRLATLLDELTNEMRMRR